MKRITVTIKKRGVAPAHFTGLFASTCEAVVKALDMLTEPGYSITARVAA